MEVKPLTLLLAALSFSGFAGPVPAALEETQSLRLVQRAAEKALRRELDPESTGIELIAADLDARLRVPACTAALETQTTLPRGSQTRVLVRVGCRAASWNINVPVDIRRQTTVLVLRRAVARGESIGVGDVSVQTRVLAGLNSPYVTDIADLKGRLTRRPLPEGTAVTAEAMNVALLIHRGQSVTLAAATAGIEVRAPGIAMADAAANQRVRVQNLNSLKVVEGVADITGVVRVNP